MAHRKKEKTVKKRRRPRRPVIGWREWIAFPELGIDAIKAKVDTGARTSALDAFDVEEFERGGRAMVRFMVHPLQKSSLVSIPVELPLLARRRVRDSGGKVQLRPVVRTMIELLGVQWEIELTLTRRDLMGFRMLLGRQAIRGRFVVDPASSFRGGKYPSQVVPSRRKARKK